MKDLIKFVVALALYGGLAPMLGVLMTTRRVWQRWVFVGMIVATGLRPGNFTFMLWGAETYRGHTKGFEVSLIEVLALALIIAVARARRGQRFKKVRTPGLILFLVWCSVALLSAVGSAEPSYALMSASRFFKGSLIFMASAYYLRSEEDLKWAIGGWAVALLHQGLVTFKMRTIDGFFQVKGLFEHQNPMAMWCYLGALPVFALALHPKVKGPLLWLLMAGYGGAAIAILLSVSRAALAAYAIGSAFLLALAWLRGPNLRATGVTLLAMLGMTMVVAFGLDSFKARLAEVSESSEENEMDLRDVLNKQSAAMLDDNPVLGIGWNNFGVMNSRPHGAKYSGILESWDEDRGFTIYDENYYANPLTESLYWLWLAETGWLGFLTFALFLFVSLTWALREMIARRGTLAGAFAAGLLVTLTICYGHGLVERILTQTKNFSQWMILSGMGAGLVKARREKYWI